MTTGEKSREYLLQYIRLADNDLSHLTLNKVVASALDPVRLDFHKCGSVNIKPNNLYW